MIVSTPVKIEPILKSADSLVVALPELDGADVGRDEDGATEDGVEGRGKDGRHEGLREQHR